MDTVQDLEQLAEICLENARILKQHLKSNGHPLPTFDQNGPISYPDMSHEAQVARLKLRDASKSLNELANGPDHMGQYAMDCLHDLSAFRYAWKYKVYDAVPDNDIISYKELAAKTGTNEKQMRKFVRQLIQIHVLCESKPNHVAHTATSKALQHPGVQAFNAFISYDNVPYMTNQLAAIDKWGHNAQGVNQSPPNLVYGNDWSIYDTFDANPELLQRFSTLMKHVSSFEHFSNAHVLTGFDWNSIGDGVVVDVAGSLGHCCVDIARANPRVKCIVQDLPKIIAHAENPATCIIPMDLRDRISFMPHSFYDPQPIPADVFFLRMIMHDYSDTVCMAILRAIVPAMRTGSRIVIMDQVMAPVGAAPPVIERVARSMQLQMQVLSNGVEREYEEWVELLEAADKRLKIKNVKQPPGSLLAVIEVVLEGSDLPAKEESWTSLDGQENGASAHPV